MSEAASPAFRRDINGLRALAVIAVVLFHYGLARFTGGFVGVDVFFVISGFLMTSIVAGGARKRRFRVIDFYIARAKRIMPALIVVVLSSLAVSAALLLPEQFMTAAREAVQASLFSINVHFADSSDYFAPREDQSWFLHCWSLAVEIQFYLIIPFVILLSLRCSAKFGVLGGLAVAFLASLAVSWIETRTDAKGAFYLPFSRVWEFAAGGLISELRSPTKFGGAIAAIGSALIVAACLGFNSQMAYPGVWPLIPVFGAALVIWGRSDVFFLSNRIAQFLGDTSYSIYLWHWPVLMAGKSLTDQQSPMVILVEFAAVLVLSYLSHRYVEKPFREAWRGARLYPIASAAAALLIVCGLGWTIVARNGFPERLPKDVRKLVSTGIYEYSWRDQKCFLGPEQGFADFAAECFLSQKSEKPTIFLMGDSTVAQYFPGLMAQPWSSDFAIEQATASACPLYGLPAPSARPFCPEIRDKTIDLLLAQKPDIVMISTAREDIALVPPEIVPLIANPYRDALTNIVHKLKQGGIGEVIVLGTPPVWGAPFPVVFARNSLRSRSIPETLRPPAIDNIIQWDRLMEDITKQAGGVYVSVFKALCDGDRCRTTAPPSDGGGLIQFDSLHLTRAGAAYAVNAALGPLLRTGTLVKTYGGG